MRRVFANTNFLQGNNDNSSNNNALSMAYSMTIKQLSILAIEIVLVAAAAAMYISTNISGLLSNCCISDIAF